MRKLIGLGILSVLPLAPALAQATDSHTVTVMVPSVLQLSLDATDYLFDFGDATLPATATTTVGGTPYTKASREAYLNFLEAGPTQDFAPTSVRGTNGAEYGTVTVRTNRAQWTVRVDSIGGTLSLGNNRVKAFAERLSGKGTSSTPSPTSIAPGLSLFGASTGGQGRSEYKLYYLFTMDINDDIPLTGLNESITLTLLITSP